MRLWDRRKYCYRWPYYYQHNKECLEKSELLVDVLAFQADEIIEKYGEDVALLSMEGLDTAFTTRIQQRMKHADRTRVFSSTQCNASQMTSVLRSLDLLITSRYHAGVLSLPALVPQTAIGHDLRIQDFYGDLGIPELFVDHEDPDRYKKLSENVETLFNHYSTLRNKLKEGYTQYMQREKKNPQLFRAFIESKYPKWL
jgi:polysaccharide pyruvyl transferase WcaK-like protein